jgi:hypothetical protein
MKSRSLHSVGNMDEASGAGGTGRWVISKRMGISADGDMESWGRN